MSEPKVTITHDEAIKQLVKLRGYTEDAMISIRGRKWRKSEKAMALLAQEYRLEALRMAIELLQKENVDA